MLENLLYLDLESGRVTIKMRPDLAPKHVEQIKGLVRSGFYSGLSFHRVIDGFMAQAGCPNGDGTGGVEPRIPAEFTDTAHVRGTVSMARTQDPNSASCQFFICFAESAFLNRQYSVWGQVVDGMELVEALKTGDPNANGTVTDPDRIVSMSLAEETPIEIV